MKKLFGDLKMNWLTVLLFAVAAGLYTGVVMMVPFLEGTSFRDIGISYEWWVVFAVIVVVNCRKWWDAALKCFVFFLISQPLCYAVQVACGCLSLTLAKTYYFSTWFPMTLLTLPGGAIAYFCKKENILGAAVLGLGNTILTVMGAVYVLETAIDFPHHLLTAVFCFAAIGVMTLCIQKRRLCRMIAFALPVVLTAAAIVYLKSQGLYLISDVAWP